MLYFRNDYSEGAHPRILEALTATNLVKTAGYGQDPFCEKAAAAIRTLCAAPEAEVHFLVGGTQTNKTAIGAFLRPYEAVIAADSGHICTHETGAIEHDGHKIISLPSPDGKLTPAMVERAAAAHTTEHMVAPRLVYLSNTTELGTVYTKKELYALHQCCSRHSLLLYCDGARLGAAMTAEGGDTSFPDYASCCDAFTIGGTKNGLLFGEALVLVHPGLREGFRFSMKQQGAMLAKGRLLGVQFQALLEDGLYLALARHANDMAALLRKGLLALGFSLAVPSTSNMLFPLLSTRQAEALSAQCAFEIQDTIDQDHVCIRLVTSWATTPQEVQELLQVFSTV